MLESLYLKDKHNSESHPRCRLLSTWEESYAFIQYPAFGIMTLNEWRSSQYNALERWLGLTAWIGLGE